MGLKEATGLIEKLLDRPRPPQTIIVDWTALHVAPPEFFGVSQTPSIFSLDYLTFALGSQFSDTAHFERNANATWQEPDRFPEFRGGNIDALLNRSNLFARYSRPKDFANSLNSMCTNSQTRFVVVRFPIFLKGHLGKVRQSFESDKTIDQGKPLTSTKCSIEFVDFFAESAMGEEEPSTLYTNEENWSDFYHFRPAVGGALLKDPRLGGVETTVSNSS